MASVDDRVVSMSFDNAAFERRLAETLKSLDKLQQSLDFANAGRGLGELERAARGFNLGPMSASIDGVSKSFLALSTVAITVLSNITTKALDAGLSIVKSLSLDQVIGGFQEYETNMKSIQTILANTKADGTNLEQVNDALDELNEYADLTIYNFAEMARNIGTFTAAGVDLETSTASIKGIANAAAISGSTSQQASTAMYQLSQAIASGTLKLMDWNSVVNAGMGGEVMQRALFTTGKAMGTLTNVPLDQSFDDWKDAGNSFRESLQDGWITTEVLTTTLKGFSGEVTDAELAAAGFSEEMIAQFQELGDTGIEAATKVRTFTQLIDTVQEAIGSGWSQTFRIFLGDFEEATSLFTEISDSIGAFVDASSTARNQLLQDWKDLGGRDVLIQGLRTAVAGLGEIFAPIREAFREIFPPVTAQRLKELTDGFYALMIRMRPGAETVDNLRRIFRGFFNAIKVTFDLIKIGAGVVFDFFSALREGSDTSFLDILAEIGDVLASLTAENLIEKVGEVFGQVFGFINDLVTNPRDALESLKDTVVGFLEGLSANVEVPDVLAGAFARLQQRWEQLQRLGDRLGDIWDGFRSAMMRVREVLEEVWTVIRDWFKDLGNDMAAAAEPGDFDAVLDVVNVGLLGGIAALLAKFATGGIDLDFGGGLLETITESFEELTGVLKAMQADIRAKAILKIAIAIGVLTASVAVLATIDSAALTKALTAMSVGFGQLVAVLAIVNKLALGPQAATSFVVLSTGMIALSGAMLLMAVAAKVLASMSWEELARGMAGVISLMGTMVASSKLLAGNSAGMIKAATSMIILGVALNILALAVRQFASMSWEEMGQGLAGVAGALITLAAAMRLMPVKQMVLTAPSLIAVGIALNLIALAVLQFAQMSLEDLGKGFLGIAGGLTAIGIAMRTMPKTLPVTASGLVLVSIALNAIAFAMSQFASMSWEEIGRGLAGMAGALIVLAIATNLMSGAVGGAIAIGIVAAALYLLVDVVQEFAGLSIGQLVKGILAMAATLIALGLVAAVLSPLIPVMLGLGAAMLLLGVGFAAFGIGANLTARAFKVLADAGTAGIGVLMALMDALILRIPAMTRAFAEGLVELGMVFLRAAPVLIEQLGVVIVQLLDTLITLIPKFQEVASTAIGAFLQTVRERGPEVIETGLAILLAFLQGVRENIFEITTLGVEIILSFIEAITEKIPDIVDAAVDLIVAFVEGVAENIDEVVTAGADLLVAFLEGIANNLGKVIEAVGLVITTYIAEVANLAGDIVQAGVDALVDFLSGIVDNLSKVVDAVGEVITTFIEEVAGLHGDILDAGFDALKEFLRGIGDNLIEVVNTVGDVISEFVIAVGDNADKVVTAGVDTVIAFIEGLGQNAIKLANAAADVLIDFLNGLSDAIDTKAPEIRAAGRRLGTAIIDGMTGGLASGTSKVAEKAKDVAKGALDSALSFLGISSPSKEFIWVGEQVVAGFAEGLSDTRQLENSSEAMAKRTTDSFTEALRQASLASMEMVDTSPTITPVLDLTQIQRDAKTLTNLVDPNAVVPVQQYAVAASIASTEIDDGDTTPTDGETVVEKMFEQNIYAPQQLSTADIYRQTRNQLAVAKEELSIPS